MSRSQNVSPIPASSQSTAPLPSLWLLPVSPRAAAVEPVPGWSRAGCPPHTYTHRALGEPPATSPRHHHPPRAAAAGSFGVHHAVSTLRVPAPSCLLIPPFPGGMFPPPAPQEGFTYAKHGSSPQRSTRRALTNPNSCSAVPSAVVTDGCCEQRGVAVGNNQNNGSTRLREQHWRSQPSSAWILLRLSAGSHCSPGWLAAAPAPGPGDVGCQEQEGGDLEQYDLWFNPHLGKAGG